MLWILIISFIIGYLWYTDHLEATVAFFKEVYDWIYIHVESYDWSNIKETFSLLQDYLFQFWDFSYTFILNHPQESKGFLVGALFMYLLFKITHISHSPKVVVKHR
jgi:hypothetical protein